MDAEIKSIEAELKHWFLYRRLQAERAMSIRKLLKEYNFIGLNNDSSQIAVSNVQKTLWKDLTTGMPKLEDSLSINAREMKADMYLDMFKRSADLENPCFNSGTSYLHCLQENFRESHENRSHICRNKFINFDLCRKDLIQRQEDSINKSIEKQDVMDRRARDLFNRRMQLLHRV